jgi:hypothetical protein
MYTIGDLITIHTSTVYRRYLHVPIPIGLQALKMIKEDEKYEARKAQGKGGIMLAET